MARPSLATLVAEVSVSLMMLHVSISISCFFPRHMQIIFDIVSASLALSLCKY